MKKNNEVLKQREYYKNTADIYDSQHCMDDEHKIAIEIINQHLSDEEDGLLLDIGTGTGRAIRYLNLGKDRVYGVDPVIDLLRIASRKHGISNGVLIAGSGDKLPFSDNTFEYVTAFGVMHHVRNPEKLISEMCRVSRGSIYISDANRFGQGAVLLRYVKLIVYKLGLWKVYDKLRTRGKGYIESVEDGISYSYSVYDSISQLRRYGKTIDILPTSKATHTSLLHPLLTCSHALIHARGANSATPDAWH